MGATPDRPRMMLDALPDVVLLVDPVTHVIEDASAPSEKILGRPRYEIVGARLDDLLRPSDSPRLPELLLRVDMEDGSSATAMMAFVIGRRRPLELEVGFRSVRGTGSGHLIVVSARDVRSTIESQARLQRLAQAEHARAAELNAVIRAMGDSVVVCDADGTISLSNPAADRLFPDVEERTYAEILEQLEDPDSQAPELQREAGPVELRTRGEPGRWIQISTYPVTMGVGVASGGEETIVVMRDVTEARRQELVRETFIGVLSHELRTPLTMIFGGSKLLAREDSTLDDATRREIFRDIHDEAERLQRLIEDIVALNRFGEVPGEVGWEPVLLQRLIPRVVQSEEGRWPGTTFEFEMPADLPTVSADPTYVEQVLRNLLSNAAKYGGAGSVVRLSARPGDQEVEVRILDDGPGFPAAEADRLFELFYRSPTTAGAAAGAGIGLFVCARLVAAMGGRIWAAPRPHGGAEFGFALATLDEDGLVLADA
jgi:two-component system, OmpR family, phosphate regulon sensor histidine kinase PhoR